MKTDVKHAIGAALLVATIAVILTAIDPAFFVKDDFQLEFLPASHEIAQAWGSGELPLLTRGSWMCAALSAEYQFGVFSIFRMLLEGLAWLLPLTLAARGTLLFIAHAAIAGAGGFLLARSYGVRASSALMVAIVAGLNGWMLWWGTSWYAIAASFAWLPWYWLALRGIAAGRRWSWVGAAVALYLLITGGAPYVVAMAAVVALMNVVGHRRRALAMIGASALGLMLSAPAVLMLLEYFPVTARSNAATAFEDLWIVPLRALFAFVVPAFSARWETFLGPMQRPGVELLGAFVPLAAIAAWLWTAGVPPADAQASRLRGWRRDAATTAGGTPAVQGVAAVSGVAALLGVAVLLLLLMLLPSAGPFRWSFRWLPLFHLVLALLGAIALERARRAWIAGLALLGVTALVAFNTTTLVHAALIAVLCLLWARFERAMPAVITIAMIVATFLAFHDRNDVPRWRIDASPSLDSTRRYLAMYDLESVIPGRNPELLPGNLPMLHGLHFVNGYSPMGLAALKNLFLFDVHGPMQPARAESLLRFESGRNQLLHHFGIDGLIVNETLARRHAAVLAKNGWQPVAAIANCLVLHRAERLREPLFEAALAFKTADEQQAYAAIFGRRTPQLPVVLFTPGGKQRYGARAISDVAEARNHTSLLVRGKGPKALIVFRRPWMPGWRATIAGRELPVLRADMAMPAIEIPPDAEGEVRLVYRPRSLVIGMVLAALALIAMAAVASRIPRAR
jgi:hypothetical protein